MTNRKSTTTNELKSAYVTLSPPKGGSKTDYSVFRNKIQF